MRSSFSLLASLLVLASCTTDPNNPDEAGSGAETSASETGSELCEGYADASQDPPLQIVVRNTRDTPVYLMTRDDCTFNHVHVSGDAGHWPSGDCEPTCAQVIAGSCQCPGACAAPQLLRVEAGAEYTLDWAYLLVPDTVAPTCVATDLCAAGDCPRATAPPDGSYTISADVLFAPSECEGPDDPCACPAGESWCVTSAIVGGGTPPDLELDVAITLPDGPLELVVE